MYFFFPNGFRCAFIGQYENEEEALLSISNILDHTHTFLSTLLRFDFLIPYNNILKTVGIVGAVILLWEIYNRREKKRILLECGIVTIFSVIFFAHFLGDPINQTSLRFFLITNISLALLALYALTYILSTRTHLIVAVVLYLLYHPVAVRNEYMNALLYPREAVGTTAPYKNSNTMLLSICPVLLSFKMWEP